MATADSLQLLCVSDGAEPTGDAVDVNEAEALAWVPITDVQQLITEGTIVALQAVLLDRWSRQPLPTATGTDSYRLAYASRQQATQGTT